MILFQTERLLIRQYKVSDFTQFFQLNSDPDVMRYIRSVSTKKQAFDSFNRELEGYINKPGLGRWGMYDRKDDKFIGSFAVLPVQHSVSLQLGYALLKENWGKGYASEAVRGGLKYAFGNLGLTEISGITYPENTSSQKVLIKNGFLFDRMIEEDGIQMHLYVCDNKVLSTKY